MTGRKEELKCASQSIFTRPLLLLARSPSPSSPVFPFSSPLIPFHFAPLPHSYTDILFLLPLLAIKEFIWRHKGWQKGPAAILVLVTVVWTVELSSPLGWCTGWICKWCKHNKATSPSLSFLLFALLATSLTWQGYSLCMCVCVRMWMWMCTVDEDGESERKKPLPGTRLVCYMRWLALDLTEGKRWLEQEPH